jgi:hypothetical protein
MIASGQIARLNRDLFFKETHMNNETRDFTGMWIAKFMTQSSIGELN